MSPHCFVAALVQNKNANNHGCTIKWQFQDTRSIQTDVLCHHVVALVHSRHEQIYLYYLVATLGCGRLLCSLVNHSVITWLSSMGTHTNV